MIVLMIAIWAKAGGGSLSEVGSIFSGGNRSGEFEGLGAIGAFVAVFSIMVGYFAAVVINFGDFARFVSSEAEMRKGNLWGLVGNVVFFSFVTLMITGGTIAIFGEYIADPTAMVAKIDNILLTIIAAFAFFAATVGINMVANFIPPAYDLANLLPSKIDFRMGGLITAIFGFVIGGFNRKAILAWLISGYIAVGSVWPNILVFGLDDFFANLGGGGGYAWIIGASLGALVHLAISRK